MNRFIFLCSLVLCSGGLLACSKDAQQNSSDPQEDMSITTPQDMAAARQDMRAEEPQDMRTQADMSPADMGDPALTFEQGCNPVAFEHDCLFPYPSNVFLVDDAAMPSGHRVQLGEAAKLKLPGNKPAVDFMSVHPVDGFSHHQPIMMVFGEELDLSTVTFHDGELSETLRPTSTTILLEADTGEPVMHWAEVDRNESEPEDRVFIVRTLTNLRPETRYIVAVQGLKNTAGELVKTPRGFEALRDGTAGEHAVLGPLAARYNTEVFPALERFGVERSAVQLAWDFTTQSREWTQRDMLHMRADLMARLEATPPAVTLNKVITQTGNEQVALRLEGTITVPWYLKKTAPLAGLDRGEDGLPRAQTTHEVPFLLQVPTSAMPQSAGFEPARLMQYGHGFFGSHEEINYGFMRGFANEQSYVTASVGWWGMREEEISVLPAPLVNDPERAILFLDDVHQGMMNFMALSYALKTTIKELDELKRFDTTLYDDSEVYYYGISQGQILGGTFLALSPHIKRAVFSVGGAPFSFMMSRSSNFVTFFLLIDAAFKSKHAVQKFITLSQHSFDRIDPSTYAENILKSPLPDAPAERKVLVQFGLWDHSVPSLSSMNHVRMMGVPLLTPSPMGIPGLEEVTAPVDGSATTMVDYELEDPTGIYAMQPTMAQSEHVEKVLNVHESVRKNPKIKQQIDAFLRPGGLIEHTCEGPCNPE